MKNSPHIQKNITNTALLSKTTPNNLEKLDSKISTFKNSNFKGKPMKFLHRTANQIAEKFGYALIPDWRLDLRAQALCLQQLFERQQVDLVIDVGANIGQYYNFLRNHVGYTSWVVSFEPDPNSYQQLKARLKNDARLRIIQKALGSEVGKAYFNLSAASTLNSFREPDFESSKHGNKMRQIVERIEVEVDLIDHLLPGLLDTLQVSRPYLKMDTQGFDLEVLRGAKISMKRFVGLQFEGSVIPIYKNMPHLTDMLAYIEPYGFRISDMFAVSKDEQLRAIEFDCVMIRSD
jgi:FkbM family methyltransferase